MLRAMLIGCSSGALIATGVCLDQAWAADDTAAPASPLEEVVVSVTKGVTSTKLQDTPLAISALGEKQLEALHLDTIAGLTNQIPNVRFNNAGVSTYSNAFFIRGMGVFSSIPSSTPAVGIFVDGVYVGANAGAIPPGAFDLKEVEVARGPQGLLFGRNTTAGAVLLQSTDPTPTWHVDASSAVETGLNYVESGVITGPLTENGTLQAKIAGYYDHDEGYFHNLTDGNRHFGKSDSNILRGALAWHPNVDESHMLKFEAAKTSGDGPAIQDHFTFSPNTLKFNNDNNGFIALRRQNATEQSHWNVGFGDGVIVNIAGWRHSEVRGAADITGTSKIEFDGYSSQIFNQYSDELRYSGAFGPLMATVGLFGYADSLDYVEGRNVVPIPHRPIFLKLIGGGDQISATYAAFSNFEYEILPALTLTIGARYSIEHKGAKIELIAPGQPCSLDTSKCGNFNFHGHKDWFAFTPKIGPSWQPTEDTNLYSYWTRGFRSGGYNVRQTDPTSPPYAYDQESVDTYEIGLKQRFFDKKMAINIAAFDNKYKNLQRDLAYQTPGSLGNVATTQNVGNATIAGTELELTAALTPDLLITGNYGYLSNKWDHLAISPVSQNGRVTPADYLLRLPQIPRNSYGGAVHYTLALTQGALKADVQFQHVDRAPADDDNLTSINPVDNLDASLTYILPDDRTSLSLYGKDLLNKTVFGINTIDVVGRNPQTTNAPLTKARVVGLQARYKF